ncbi:hypothetical protein PLESTB_000879300 [Pleodorina starrii]|uniref:Uncharacterized protein n=1 Tax=Pleodorina starrii TaxID=330485 RepID=A0A9W6F3P8_9CHLO|nr:hypothetical protein PLESTB_000879300 [Pleodorina starrii]
MGSQIAQVRTQLRLSDEGPVYTITGFNAETTEQSDNGGFGMFRLEHPNGTKFMDYHTYLACKDRLTQEHVLTAEVCSVATGGSGGGGSGSGSGRGSGSGGGGHGSGGRASTQAGSSSTIRTYADGTVPRDPMERPAPSVCAWSGFDSVFPREHSPISNGASVYWPFNAVLQCRQMAATTGKLVFTSFGVCRKCYNECKSANALMFANSKPICPLCLHGLNKRGCVECLSAKAQSEAKQLLAARVLEPLKHVYHDYEFRINSEARVWSDAGGQFDKRYDAAIDIIMHNHKMCFRLEVIDSKPVTADSWNMKLPDLEARRKSLGVDTRAVLLVAYQDDNFEVQYSHIRQLLDALIQHVVLLPANGIILITLGVVQKVDEQEPVSKRKKVNSTIVTMDALRAIGTARQVEVAGHLQGLQFIKRVLHLPMFARPYNSSRPFAYISHPAEAKAPSGDPVDISAILRQQQ